MTTIESFINVRMQLWIIDAKYLERTEFYYKVWGEIEAMRGALMWLAKCSDGELTEALCQLITFRELLDEWYYGV